MTKRIANCYCCKGEGEELIEYDDIWGNTSSYYQTCEFCGGEGTIEEELRECRECKEPHWLYDMDTCDTCTDKRIEEFVRVYFEPLI